MNKSLKKKKNVKKAEDRLSLTDSKAIINVLSPSKLTDPNVVNVLL